MLIACCAAIVLTATGCGNNNTADVSPTPKVINDQTSFEKDIPPTRVAMSTVTATPDSIGEGIPTPMPPESLDADGDGWLTVDEYVFSLRAMYPAFRFPPGYEMDIDSIAKDLEDPQWATSRFQIDYAYTGIGLPQLCAWAMHWLDNYHAGNADAATEALDSLDDVVTTNPAFGSMRSDIESWVRSARLGDPAPLQSYVNYDCADRIEKSGRIDPKRAIPHTARSRTVRSDNQLAQGKQRTSAIRDHNYPNF